MNTYAFWYVDRSQHVYTFVLEVVLVMLRVLVVA